MTTKPPKETGHYPSKRRELGRSLSYVKPSWCADNCEAYVDIDSVPVTEARLVTVIKQNQMWTDTMFILKPPSSGNIYSGLVTLNGGSFSLSPH